MLLGLAVLLMGGVGLMYCLYRVHQQVAPSEGYSKVSTKDFLIDDDEAEDNMVSNTLFPDNDNATLKPDEEMPTTAS